MQGLSHGEASRAGLGWQPGPELSPKPQSCLAAYPHCHQWEGATLSCTGSRLALRLASCLQERGVLLDPWHRDT